MISVLMLNSIFLVGYCKEASTNSFKRSCKEEGDALW
jgi:hypothetical protein